MLRNNRGATLPLIIVIFAVIMIFGSAMMFFQMSEGRASIRHKNETEAYYMARSAVESVSAAIREGNVPGRSALVAEVIEMVNDPTPDPIVIEGFQALDDSGALVSDLTTARVEIFRINDHQVEVYGTATVNGISEEASVILDNSFFYYSIHAASDLDIGGMYEIAGENIAIDPGGSFDETQDSGAGGVVDVVYDDIIQDVFDYTLVLPSDDDGDGNYEDDDGNPVELYETDRSGSADPGDGLLSLLNDMFTPPDELDVARIFVVNGNTDSIDITDELSDLNDPDKILVLYIDGDMILTFQTPSPSEVTYTNPEQLILLLGPNTELIIKANSTFYGYVYGPEASVELQSGGGATSASSDEVLFSGSIVAESFVGSANATLEYHEPSSGSLVETMLRDDHSDNFKLVYWEK